MKNLLKTLANSVLIPLGLISAALATDATIHKKIFGPSMTALIISYKEMNDIMKIDNSLKESGLLTKCVSKTIENQAKKQKKKDFSKFYRHFRC